MLQWAPGPWLWDHWCTLSVVISSEGKTQFDVLEISPTICSVATWVHPFVFPVVFLKCVLQCFAEMKVTARLGWFINVLMLLECYLYINYMCQTCACLIISTEMIHALSNREYNLYLCHVLDLFSDVDFWKLWFSLVSSENEGWMCPINPCPSKCYL